jgi:succinate-acetate transporter protein
VDVGSTFRLSRLLFCIFLTLWLAFFLLGVARAGNPFAPWAAGSACSAGPWRYGSFALITNATYGREVVPVGSR